MTLFIGNPLLKYRKIVLKGQNLSNIDHSGAFNWVLITIYRGAGSWKSRIQHRKYDLRLLSYYQGQFGKIMAGVHIIKNIFKG